MTRSSTTFSNDEARRIALGAQGLGEPRPAGRVDRRHFRKLLSQIGLLQIDSVNVLARSQELPVFARLGAHPRTLIDDASRDGELFEYMVHEASLLPSDQYYLHRWRMEERLDSAWFRQQAAALGDYVEQVYRRVRDEGAMVAGDLKARVGKKGTWWDYDDGKLALEALFYTGRLAARRRPRDFARVYDLPERIVPAAALARTPLEEHAARKELLVLAGRYHGIGTLNDLADYHRLGQNRCKLAMSELVDEGRLLAVTVREWDRPAYLHPEARLPRRVDARALLSPFDPIVWNRERALRLFDFHYRIEIYTPAAKRRHGYYVLPILLGDQLVGRVDLKADRANGALLVQSVWSEPGADDHAVAGALVEELRLMATWLGLQTVEISGRGNLGPLLQRLH